MKTAKAKKSIREISASEFKAKCLAIITQVDKTKTPIRVTKRGKPIVEVQPVSPRAETHEWFGSMEGKIDFLGDIVSPVMDLDDIEALKS